MINSCYNAIPQALLNKIHGLEIPWFSISTDYYSTGLKNPHSHTWVHLAFADGVSVSPLGDFMEALALATLEKTGQDIDQLIRVRLGMHTCCPSSFVGGPHVDQETPHQTALIYLNSADGNTILYNEKYDPKTGLGLYDYYRTALKHQVTINQEIIPEENKMIWFDGFQYHSSSSPTKSGRRMVININYTVK